MSLGEKVLGFLLILALLVPLAIFDGVILMFLWKWFVATQFGLPPLGIAQAIGISVIAGFLTHQARPTLEPDEHLQLLGNSIKNNTIFFLIGYVASFFL